MSPGSPNQVLTHARAARAKGSGQSNLRVLLVGAVHQGPAVRNSIAVRVIEPGLARFGIWSVWLTPATPLLLRARLTLTRALRARCARPPEVRAQRA